MTSTKRRSAINHSGKSSVFTMLISWLELAAISYRACLRSVLMVCLLALTVACSTPHNTPHNAQVNHYDSGIAVVGITGAKGTDIAFNRNLLARDFAELLAARNAYSVIPASSVRQYLGPVDTDRLLSDYARDGFISAQGVQTLIESGLPGRYAVFARIEGDEILKLPVRREAVFNESGEKLADRERRVLGTQRATRMAALMVDLRTGRQLWEQQYQVDPIVEVASTHYLGSSFSGSLAAAFANSVVNGVRVQRHPDAPPLRTSVQTLLREVTREMPVR